MATTASQYLSRLGRLLLQTHVRNRSGAAVPLNAGAARAAAMILQARDAGRTVYVVGNGGSAAIAGHMHNDLCKVLGVRAMVFNEQALLTALANDIGYAAVFEHPLRLWAQPGDLLLAISSSGKSQSILRAARLVRRSGGRIITLSGFAPGNPLRRLGDLNFYVRSPAYGHVEMAHACLLHFMIDRAVESPGHKA